MSRILATDEGSIQNPEINQDVILVVDDDALTRGTLAKILSRVGYRVIKAENGAAALDQFDAHQPRLVLMDVVMPEMDGFSACKELRKRAGAYSLPILMMTGLEDKEAVDKAFEAGATDFITKPINWSLLDQRVRYALRTREIALRLAQNEARLAHAQRAARMGYWIYDIDSGHMHCSDELFYILGREAATRANTRQSFIDLVHGDDQAVVDTAMLGALEQHVPFTLDHRMVRTDGSTIAVQHQAEVEYGSGGSPTRLVGTVIDITARKKAEDLVRYQANFDALTGLPNRQRFVERVAAAMDRCREGEEMVALLFLSLDRFRTINETLGHEVADQLLRSAASRLRGLEADGYQIARFSNNVFAVLAASVATCDIAESLASRLYQIMSASYVIDRNEIYSSVSIGISYYPMGLKSDGELMRAADLALHGAREQGGNQIQSYSADMSAASQRRMELANELHKALEREQFAIHFQPQVQCESWRLLGLEALLRWRHPELGMISPIEFIPVAEEIGLINEIGEWVLFNACEQLRRWHEQGLSGLRMGVNLSARQFGPGNLVDQVRRALSETGIPPHCLDLEVTESLALHDFSSTVEILHQCNRLGVRTSLDDFGTGFSSLSYLNQLPVQTIKIDQAFVKDIGPGGQNSAIANAVIAMARSLNMNTIAEGVENSAQLAHLCSHGCKEIQGYFFSPPKDIEGVNQVIEQARSEDRIDSDGYLRFNP